MFCGWGTMGLVIRGNTQGLVGIVPCADPIRINPGTSELKKRRATGNICTNYTYYMVFSVWLLQWGIWGRDSLPPCPLIIVFLLAPMQIEKTSMKGFQHIFHRLLLAF